MLEAQKNDSHIISEVPEHCPERQNHIWEKLRNSSLWGRLGTFFRQAKKIFFFHKKHFFVPITASFFQILFHLPPPFFLTKKKFQNQNVCF